MEVGNLEIWKSENPGSQTSAQADVRVHCFLGFHSFYRILPYVDVITN